MICPCTIPYANPLPCQRRGFLFSRKYRGVISTDRENINDVPSLRLAPSDPVKQRHPPPNSFGCHRVIAVPTFHQLCPLSFQNAPGFAFRRQRFAPLPCRNRPFRDHERGFHVFHVPHDFPCRPWVFELIPFANVTDRKQFFHVIPPFCLPTRQRSRPTPPPTVQEFARLGYMRRTQSVRLLPG